MKELEKRVSKMDLEMKNFEKDLKSLQDFFEKIKKIEERYKNLEKYYYSEWIDDTKNWKDLMYGILSEDWLRNLFWEKYEIEKNILKFLVNKL